MTGIFVQEKEMEKQKLLYQQARLHDRGAAEMVLQTISASKGNILLCRLHAKANFLLSLKLLQFLLCKIYKCLTVMLAFKMRAKFQKLLAAHSE